MTIRRAQYEDVLSIADFIRAFADEHHALEESHKRGDEYRDIETTIGEWLRDRDVRLLVAEDVQGPVGYLRASVLESASYAREKKIGMIDDVYVAPPHRKRGVLRALLGEALAWFQKKRVPAVELNVLVKNRDAIAAWRALGFEDYKLRMRRML